MSVERKDCAGGIFRKAQSAGEDNQRFLKRRIGVDASWRCPQGSEYASGAHGRAFIRVDYVEIGAGPRVAFWTEGTMVTRRRWRRVWGNICIPAFPLHGGVEKVFQPVKVQAETRAQRRADAGVRGSANRGGDAARKGRGRELMIGATDQRRVECFGNPGACARRPAPLARGPQCRASHAARKRLCAAPEIPGRPYPPSQKCESRSDTHFVNDKRILFQKWTYREFLIPATSIHYL